MVEVLIVSENNTAVEMLKTVHRVLGAGAVRNMHALRIKSSFSREKARLTVEKTISALRTRPDGVVFLVEVYGSTQANLCLNCIGQGGVSFITGYNLPMLIKAATLNQSASLRSFVTAIKSAGRKYIRVMER